MIRLFSICKSTLSKLHWIISLRPRLFPWKKAISIKHIEGKNNQINIKGAKIRNLSINLEGDNNQITIEPGALVNNLIIRIRGANHVLYIHKGCRILRGGLFWFEDEYGLIEIGERTTIEQAHFAVTEPKHRITVGTDCMMAYDIEIRTGDSHSIIDLMTKKRINYAKDVTIGNHVWISRGVSILKGVEIKEGSIVATGAVVTKSFGENVVIGGNPAKVLKTGVTWQRERVYH